MSDFEALLLWLNAFQPDQQECASVESIADGSRIAAALCNAMPGDFGSLVLRPGGSNWVMLRGNLNRIVESCATFCVTYLGAASQVDITSLIDTTMIARDKDEHAATKLLSLAFTVSLLGDTKECLSRIKGLPKETQATLQRIAKSFTSELGLKKRGPPKADPAQQAKSPTEHARIAVFAANRLTETEVAALQHDLTDLQEKLNTKEDEIRNANDRFGALQADFETLRNRYEALLESSSRNEAVRSRETNEKIAEYVTKISSLEQELHTVKDNNRDLQENRRELQRKIDEMLRERAGSLDKNTEELLAARKETSRLKAECDNLMKEKLHTDEEIRTLRLSCDSLKLKVEELDTSLQAAKSRSKISEPLRMPLELPDTDATDALDRAKTLNELQKRVADLERELVDTRSGYRDRQAILQAQLFESGRIILSLKLQLSALRSEEISQTLASDPQAPVVKPWYSRLRSAMFSAPLVTLSSSTQ